MYVERNGRALKVAVMTIAYNEENFIGACIKNWQGKVAKHCVFLSSKPWHGMELPQDKTEEIARALGAEVIKLHWPSETSQRNWALGYLYEYDYVLVIDADEFFTEEDQLKLLEGLGTMGMEEFVDNINCYRAPRMITYFKTPDYILDPPDGHKPLIAIDPKKMTFKDCRIPSQEYEIELDITMHHLSYLRNDLRLYHKMQQFEHYNQIKPNWYKEKWQKWTPEMENVRAYGREESKAVPGVMPQEIIDLVRG